MIFSLHIPDKSFLVYFSANSLQNYVGKCFLN